MFDVAPEEEQCGCPNGHLHCLRASGHEGTKHQALSTVSIHREDFTYTVTWWR